MRPSRDFAQSEVAPLVSQMDEAQELDPALLPMLFELGLMGIEIPEEFGGTDASLFTSVLVVESAFADRSLGRNPGRRAEHPGGQRAQAVGKRRAEGPLLPSASHQPGGCVRPVRGRERIRRLRPRLPGYPGRRRLAHHGPETLDHERERGGHLHRLRYRRPRGRLQRHHRLHGGSGHGRLHGRQEGGQARHPGLLHDRDCSRQRPGTKEASLG